MMNVSSVCSVSPSSSSAVRVSVSMRLALSYVIATLSLRRAGLSGEPSRYVARFLGWITVFIPLSDGP